MFRLLPAQEEQDVEEYEDEKSKMNMLYMEIDRENESINNWFSLIFCLKLNLLNR